MQEIAGLVERLRKEAARMNIRPSEARPLLTEAADALASLPALLDRIEALEAALAKIIQTDDQIGFAIGAPARCGDIARAALRARSREKPHG